MARIVLVLVLAFLVLFLLRFLRVALDRLLGRPGAGHRADPKVGELARDPICGAWFDRRLAITGRRGTEAVEVCSEGCRRRLEAG